MGFNPPSPRRWVKTHPALILLLALAHPAGAFELAPFKLSWPAACTLGDTCHIQQYPDRDPGPGATDFTCGPLSYDGHDGTDIALPDRAAMAAGVAVLAAAPGTVKGIRDGVADFAPKEDGKECGNGVVIRHANGWETQYCHMRLGSVAVRPGDIVETGSKLGLIGQSGLADFPHVHLSVRHNGQKVDPFAPGGDTCSPTLGPTLGPTLWAHPEPYEPGGFLSAGFTDAVPDFDTIRTGLPTLPLSATAPAIVIWAYVFGGRKGDVISLQITEPQGQTLRQDATLDRAQAQLFRAYGKRLTAKTWPTGSYQGLLILTRKGVAVDRMAISVTVGQ